jgi:hypothetical protein
MAVVCIEVYLGVVVVGLDRGRWLLACGIVLDGGSRLLGTVAAGRVQRPTWAWGCAIVGSPAVAMFALFGPDGPVSTEPGPLAGLLSVLAVGVIAVAVVGGALGL